MENQNDIKTISRTSSQIMDLQQLIAGPLIAAIEADAMASRSYFNFLMQIAFDDYDEQTGKAGELRMLTFEYEDKDSVGLTRKRASIPLFTLVPLPLLQMQEADFDFDIRVIDAVTETSEDTFSYEDGEMSGGPDSLQPVTMRASMAHTNGGDGSSTSGNLSANMRVNVRMKQSDLPAGISNLLHIAENSVGLVDVSAQEKGDM